MLHGRELRENSLGCPQLLKSSLGRALRKSTGGKAVQGVSQRWDSQMLGFIYENIKLKQFHFSKMKSVQNFLPTGKFLSLIPNQNKNFFKVSELPKEQRSQLYIPSLTPFQPTASQSWILKYSRQTNTAGKFSYFQYVFSSEKWSSQIDIKGFLIYSLTLQV